MGQDIQQDWHYQFLRDNGNVKILADKVNYFFLSITENFPPLSPFSPNQYVPNEFLVFEAEVYKSIIVISAGSQICRTGRAPKLSVKGICYGSFSGYTGYLQSVH